MRGVAPRADDPCSWGTAALFGIPFGAVVFALAYVIRIADLPGGLGAVLFHLIVLCMLAVVFLIREEYGKGR